MIRTFGPQALTGAAQPLMSDVTTAAVVAALDGQPALITVASTAIYQDNDRIVLEPLTANADAYKVFNILSSTVLQCVPEGVPKAHVTDVIIQLDVACSDVCVQPESADALVVIGADNTVTVTPGGSAIYVIQPATAPAQANEWHMNRGGSQNNQYRTSEAWMIGTSTNKVLVYALVN